MKKLILGCTCVLASLHIWEWGMYLRNYGAAESWTVLGAFLKLAAVALFAAGIAFGVLPGWREAEDKEE